MNCDVKLSSEKCKVGEVFKRASNIKNMNIVAFLLETVAVANLGWSATNMPH